MRDYTDALERAMGEIVARAHGELALIKERTDAVTAAASARVAEAEARLQLIEGRIAERIAGLRDGAPGAPGEPGPRGEKGERGEDGRSIEGPPGPRGAPGEVDMVAVEEIVARAVDALPKPADGPPGPRGEKGEDGRSVDPAEVVEMVARAVAELPPAPAGPKGERGEKGERGADGTSVAPVEVAAMVRDAVSALPPPERGEKGERGDPGEPGAAGQDGAPGERGPTGFLAEARAWEDRIHYAGAVAAHDGSTWQAIRDTGKAPPHEDWICLAARGADGSDGKNGDDGRSFAIRGTWLDVSTYRHLDVVALNGSSFVAKRDDPGPCPGEGWQLLSGVGKRGDRGEKGEKGDRGARGEPGAAVIGLEVDGEGMLTLTNGDGSTVRCDLYELLSKLGR